MVARAESSPERVRRMLGIDPMAPRNAPTDQEVEQVALIRQKVLSDQPAIFETYRAVLLVNIPEVLANVLEMAAGRKGAPSTQLAAAQWWLTEARGGVSSPDGRPLGELPLDQLESVLSAALENTRTLRSIAGTAQRIDSIDEGMPHQGSTPPAEGAPG